MKMHMSRRLFLPAALLGGVAVFAAVFFVALAVHSVVADPDAPNPGHIWDEIGDLPGMMWHSNNDGDGSGLDADTVDGLHANEIMGRPGFSTTTVDSAGVVGRFTSVTVGADGLPLISYQDAIDDDLKVAHCSNRFCVPYHRPR